MISSSVSLMGDEEHFSDKFFHFWPLLSPFSPFLFSSLLSLFLPTPLSSLSLSDFTPLPWFLSVHNPKVQLQVHTGRYNPAERYSPPLRPHLSLSASLSSSPSPASVWSLLVLRDKLLPSCLWLSLYVSVLFTSFLLCHTFSALLRCDAVSFWPLMTPSNTIFVLSLLNYSHLHPV